MSKKPRSDKRKNIGKVAEVVSENPNLTLQEISDKTGIGTSTAKRAKEELAKTGKSDPTLQYIIDASKNRLKKVQSVLDRFVDESLEKEELSRHDVSLIKDFANDDLKRITILGGDITDDNGGLKQIVSYIIPDNGR